MWTAIETILLQNLKKKIIYFAPLKEPEPEAWIGLGVSIRVCLCSWVKVWVWVSSFKFRVWMPSIHSYGRNNIFCLFDQVWIWRLKISHPPIILQRCSFQCNCNCNDEPQSHKQWCVFWSPSVQKKQVSQQNLLDFNRKIKDLKRRVGGWVKTKIERWQNATCQPSLTLFWEMRNAVRLHLLRWRGQSDFNLPSISFIRI